MSGSKMFSLAEDAVKDRELSYMYQKFVFNSSENRSKFYLLSRDTFIVSNFRLLISGYLG